MAGAARTTVLVLVLGLFAGCVSSDANPTIEPGSEVGDAQFAAGGTVTGVVSDLEIQPIEGALVALDGAVVSQTDAGGRFRFLNVEPGEHTVIAQALGHQSVARRVLVEAEEEVEVLFVLERLRVVEPYHETLALAGFACLQTFTPVGRFTFANLACPDPPGDVLVEFTARKGVVTIISEMVWTQSTTLAARVLGLDLWQGGVRTGLWTCDYCYGTAQGTSPVILRADGPFEGINGDEAEDESSVENIVVLRGDPNYGGQFGLIYDQRVEVYTSLFYNGPAPEAFTALPDQ